MIEGAKGHSLLTIIGSCRSTQLETGTAAIIIKRMQPCQRRRKGSHAVHFPVQVVDAAIQVFDGIRILTDSCTILLDGGTVLTDSRRIGLGRCCHLPNGCSIMTIFTICHIDQAVERIALIGLTGFDLCLRITVFIEYRIPIFICNLGDNQGRRIQISFFMAKGNCIIFAGIGFIPQSQRIFTGCITVPAKGTGILPCGHVAAAGSKGAFSDRSVIEAAKNGRIQSAGCIGIATSYGRTIAIRCILKATANSRILTGSCIGLATTYGCIVIGCLIDETTGNRGKISRSLITVATADSRVITGSSVFSTAGSMQESCS